MDGHAAQVDEAILLGHELQALHLVLNLHLALGDEAGDLSVASSYCYPTSAPCEEPFPSWIKALFTLSLLFGAVVRPAWHQPCPAASWLIL